MSNRPYYEMEDHFLAWIDANPEAAVRVLHDAAKFCYDANTLRWLVRLAEDANGYQPINENHRF